MNEYLAKLRAAHPRPPAVRRPASIPGLAVEVHQAAPACHEPEPAAALLARARARGVELWIDETGQLHCGGPTLPRPEALIAELDAMAEEIRALLRAEDGQAAEHHRAWVIYRDGEPPLSVTLTPPQSLAGVQRFYPGAHVEPVPALAAQSTWEAVEPPQALRVAAALAGIAVSDQRLLEVFAADLPAIASGEIGQEALVLAVRTLARLGRPSRSPGPKTPAAPEHGEPRPRTEAQEARSAPTPSPGTACSRCGHCDSPKQHRPIGVCLVDGQMRHWVGRASDHRTPCPQLDERSGLVVNGDEVELENQSRGMK